jgi:hypothetical protein
MSIITSASGIFTRAETSELKITKETTSLLWSANKHPDIKLLNGGITAKLHNSLSGSKAIIARSGSTIGTDSQIWILKIHYANTINIGMAKITRDLTSVAPLDPPDNVSITYSPGAEDTVVTFTLSLTTLKVEYSGKTQTIDMTPFTGEKMYPWISGVVSDIGFSVSINIYSYMKLYIEDGIAKIDTTNTDDFLINGVSVGGGGAGPTLSENLDLNGFNITGIGSGGLQNLNQIGGVQELNTTAIGTNTTNIGNNATAIGTNTTNIGNNTTAIGTNTTDIGNNTTAIGTNTTDIGTLEDKTQYQSAAASKTTFTGGINVTNGAEQIHTSSTTIAKDKHECKKAGGVLNSDPIYQDLVYADDDTGSSNLVNMISITADENHTTTLRGVDYAIWTNKNGASTTSERFRIDGDDTTYITGGLNTAGDTTTNNLNVTNELTVKCDDNADLLLKTADVGTVDYVLKSNGDGTIKWAAAGGGGGGAGPTLSENLDLNGFDITGSGFTLNGINTKTQNLSAVVGVTTNTGVLDSTTYREGAIDGEILKVKNTNSYYAGAGAGASITTAPGQLLIGEEAGSLITAALPNTAIGNKAMRYAVGSFNTAVGTSSCQSVLGGTNTGDRNVAVGNFTLSNGQTTANNVAIGYTAGSGLTSGDDNVMIGKDVNDTVTDDGASNCIVIGSGSHSAGGVNRCAIGQSITSTKDNQVMLGDAAVVEIINAGNGVCDLGSVTNAFKNLVVNQVNSLTPVGGLYSGLSDGVLISGGTIGSLLPASGVGSLSVPANGFSIGDAYHLVCAGDIPVGDKDDIITITLNQNGTQLAQLSVDMEDSTNTFFELEADFQVRSIGATGQIITNFDFTFNKQLLKDFKGSRHVQLSTIDTTSSSSLTLTAQFAGDLNSTIQTRLFYLRKQY